MTVRVVPYRQIAEEIADRLLAERSGSAPLEPWTLEVIVPSRGVAEALTAAMLARMPGGFAGAQIHSLENLARRIVNSAGEMPHVATAEERRLAMRLAARSLDEAMRESRGIAAMLERSYRDVRDSGLTLEAFRARAAGSRRLRNPARTAAIVRAWSEYERLIAKLGAVDPADLLARAAELAGPALPRQLLAGFYDLTGAQLALVRALREKGKILGTWVPTSQPFARAFLSAIREEIEQTTPAASAASVDALRCDTRLDELRHVCASVAALIRGGTDPREIGIVARSLEAWDVRLLNRMAGEAGFATTLGESIPLHAHRIGRGAATLLKLAERGFQRGDVLELVRDGLMTKTRVDADRADAATRRARVAGGPSEELRRMRSRSREIDDYVALTAELEELTANPADLLPRLGSLFRIETEQDLQAAEALEEVALLFRRAAVWNRPADAGSILDAIEQATLPLPSPSQGLPRVWAGDVMRFRGRSFTHTFALRMEDDVFPQRRLEDPLLPDSDRRALAVREIGDGLEEERLLLSLLSDSTTGQLHFTWAGGDGFGKVLRPSRYLRRLPAAGSPLQPDRGRRTAHPNHERQLHQLVRRARGDVFDGVIGPLSPALAGKLDSLSPTQLENFGECPQKFLLKHLLGAEDIDRPERELQINPRDKGTVDHAILEQFYRETTPEEIEAGGAHLPQLAPSLAARLERIVDERFDRFEAETPPFNATVRAIERRATRRLLREFLARDLADLIASGLRPRHFEYRFGRKHREEADHPEPFVVEAGGLAMRVEGTVDRIDSDGRRLRIVDYKSGKAKRHERLGDKIDRGVRLQLALYAMAVAQFFGKDPGDVSGVIRPLVEPDSRDFAFELADKRERLAATLDVFFRAIRGGVFPAYADDDKIGSCKYCPVNHSCRTRHDPEERSETERWEDARSLLTGGEE